MAAPIILASTSRYRRELLERLGVPFTSIAPACDEEALKDRRLPPQALAEMLAEAKARSISQAHPGAIVIGGDQLLEIDGAILGKPRTMEAAAAQLTRLSGREHTLITAIAVIHRGLTHRHTEIARMHLRALGSDAIARYLARDRPLDCAGSYQLERGGIVLMDRIECADHSAITGLPLIMVTRILATCGVDLP
jgi:septum formation protein